MLFDNKANNIAENIKSQKTIIIVIKELFAVGDLSLGYIYIRVYTRGLMYKLN